MIAALPSAGEVYRVPYPFVRDTYSGFDGVEGYADMPTWNPGIRNEWIEPDETGTVADALGEAIFTVQAVFKPGRFPTRVFFTRQFVNPDGKQFGKGNLHIVTLEKFRRLARGYQHPFGIGEPLPHYYNSRLAMAEFERLMAEARAAQVGRNAERQDRETGLGPKDEHAVGAADAPKTSRPPETPNPERA